MAQREDIPAQVIATFTKDEVVEALVHVHGKNALAGFLDPTGAGGWPETLKVRGKEDGSVVVSWFGAGRRARP